MTTATEKFMKHPWERYAVPDTDISADFPAEPTIDEELEGDDESVALYLNQSYSGIEVSFDLSVNFGQTLASASSEDLAQSLEKQLRSNKELRVFSVKPRALGDLCGAVQHIQIKSSQEILLQWLLTCSEYTVFCGVTVPEAHLLAVAERFLESLSCGENSCQA
jgi:hypothetical protein